MGSDLHLPEGAPIAAAVVLHPHPTMGGDRHHPLVVAVTERLAASGVAALRPDLPNPDVAAASATLSAAASDLAASTGTEHMLLVGYSWGSIVAATTAADGLVARVLVAPPVAMASFPSPDVPTLVLVPAHDQYGPPDAVHDAMGEHELTTIEVVEGCDHFLAGAVGRIADRAVAWITEQCDADPPDPR